MNRYSVTFMNTAALFENIGNCSPEEKRAVFACLKTQTQIENEIHSSMELGKPLAGHLSFIKDNFDLCGFPTRASSIFLEEVRPGPHPNGKLVQRLHELGLTIAGKTHMNEFAYGLDGMNPHVGNCPHPFNPGLCSGGSSSGSAWCVARGIVPIAFGTDTGGSIRVPAAFCGLYGLRLPPDEWAADGCFPLAPGYDSAGWFTRSAEDMKFYTRQIMSLPTPATGLRVLNALPDHPWLSPAVQNLFPEAVPFSGFASTEVKTQRVNAFNILQSQKAYKVHATLLENYSELYDPAVKARIERGAGWTGDDISRSKAVEEEMTSILETLFRSADVLLLPVSLETAPPAPMSGEQRTALLSETAPASLAKCPVLTLPVSTPEGWLGIQCVLPSHGWEKILSGLLQSLR